MEEQIGVFLAVDRLQASEVRLLTGKAEEGKQQRNREKDSELERFATALEKRKRSNPWR